MSDVLVFWLCKKYNNDFKNRKQLFKDVFRHDLCHFQFFEHLKSKGFINIYTQAATTEIDMM